MSPAPADGPGIRLRLGPVVLCLAVALYRAGWLSFQLSGFRVPEMGYLLLADLPVLGILAILVWLDARASRAWAWIALCATGVLTALYLVDVMAVVALNGRLQLQDVQRFMVEWWLIPSYVSVMSVLMALVALAAFVPKVSPRWSAVNLVWLGLSAILFWALIPREVVPSHLQKYTGSVLLVATELKGRAEPITRYRPADFAAFQSDYAAQFDAPFAKSGRNVILVIVESLSAVDSHRTSGIRNLLGRFDELSRKGLLFRNFFANFEASEGGIVSLLSGVPPLHYPTASTDTFREYSVQRSMVDVFRRHGYRCEFLTNVPLQFISMDHYAGSDIIGFTHAAGKREVERYRGAPTYAFESPADHLLYEEVLARLDQGRAPVFISAITASSHTPYVDPLGRAPREEHVWEYVQDELWWLYRELSRRNYFENGVLIVTGDHRKMLPVSQAERERYGDSAKARVPLLILGRDVPRDTLDDRLFQQADLLRLLDRALQPSAPLSPWALWVDRYIYVFGVASNAGNVEVFQPGDGGRRASRLNLRGAELDWVDRPANALEIEGAIHRQRASLQAERAARIASEPITIGQHLEPSPTPGILIGISTDARLGRDPDDPSAALRILQSDSLGLESNVTRAGLGPGRSFTMTARAFLEIPVDGPYWFSMFADDAGCLAIDGQTVLGCQPGVNEGVAVLTAGVHRFDLRYVHLGGTPVLRFRWMPPGSPKFEEFPASVLRLPSR